MAYTARDLCIRSLRLSGAVAGNQTPTPDEINEALHELNGIVSGYALESFWPASQTNNPAIITGLSKSYTVGPTSDIVTANGPLDIVEQVQLLDSGIMYNLIKTDFLNLNADSLNACAGRPQKFAYVKETANYGTLTFDRIPDKDYPIGILANAVIPAYILTDVITLPLAYSSCLEYSLASILAILYGKPDANISSIANTRFERIKQFNVKIPDLDYDLIGGNNGIYDIQTDTFLRRGA